MESSARLHSECLTDGVLGEHVFLASILWTILVHIGGRGILDLDNFRANLELYIYRIFFWKQYFILGK